MKQLNFDAWGKPKSSISLDERQPPISLIQSVHTTAAKSPMLKVAWKDCLTDEEDFVMSNGCYTLFLRLAEEI